MKNIKISKKKLAKMYSTMKVIDICKELNLCLTTFYKLLKEANIKMKKPGFKKGENKNITLVD
jgi:hypothetical protein